MKQMLWILLALVSLQQGCLAASDDAAACDPNSKDFYRQQQPLAWQPVPPERIAEADYRGRVSEARLPGKDQDLFAYKVLMNIRGSATYVSVALLDREQGTIDVKQLASQARMLLQDEARKVARERRAKEAFVTLASSHYTIVLWPWHSGTHALICSFDAASALAEEAVPTYASVPAGRMA